MHFNLEDAHLSDLYLSGAQFSTKPNFKGATFEGICRFDGAVFSEGADFSNSQVIPDAVLSLEDITVHRELLLRKFTIAEKASVLIQPRDLTNGKIEAQSLQVRGRLFIEVVGSQEVPNFITLFESNIGPSGSLDLLKSPMDPQGRSHPQHSPKVRELIKQIMRAIWEGGADRAQKVFELFKKLLTFLWDRFSNDFIDLAKKLVGWKEALFGLASWIIGFLTGGATKAGQILAGVAQIGIKVAAWALT
jgi:hypothetical protein